MPRRKSNIYTEVQDGDIIDVKALIDGRNLALKELYEAMTIFQKGRKKKKLTKKDISEIERYIENARRSLSGAQMLLN
jgi:hypothetical protein